MNYREDFILEKSYLLKLRSFAWLLSYLLAELYIFRFKLIEFIYILLSLVKLYIFKGTKG